MIKKQIALEKEMVEAGIARYRRIMESAEDAGRAAETSYAKRLMPSLCVDTAAAIQALRDNPSRIGGRTTAMKLLKDLDVNVISFITLRVIFDSLIKGSTLGNLAMTLGQRLEDQIRFARFEQQHEQYFKNVLKDFKTKNTVSYRHKHRVLTVKANEHEDGWNSWTPQERMLVGTKMIEFVVVATGIIEKVIRREGPTKLVAYIQPTSDAIDWINDHTAHAELLHPEVAPCVVSPLDWQGLNDGGYYTPAIRRRVPFVKTRSAEHRAEIADHDYSKPMEAVNELQRTPWAINQPVHDVMKEVFRRNLRIGMPPSEPIDIPPCPLPKEVKAKELSEDDPRFTQFRRWKREAALAYTVERERIAQTIQLSRVFSMAERYRDFPEFYYVYNCDFRGRIYTASPGLTPQGADFSKGLLHFAQGKAVGKVGSYWLAVQGANTYGVDKVSYDERVQWVEDHTDAICAVAADPFDSKARDFWSDSDKPYQFLAFCFEWAGYQEEGESFKSRIAVALDGSCNGLQHFSAMLRDEVGGAATNLVPASKPQDIYQRVADVCIKKLLEIDSTLSNQLLEFISRKLTKKPVMTLPYGSTKQSCREHSEDYLNEQEQVYWAGRDIYHAATFVSNHIWESIGEVVIAARAAMAWLRKAASVLSKENEAIVWYTPSGFKVYQGSMKYDSLVVKTQLCGRLMLRIAEPTHKIDSYRQANGVAPNFVHSMDAAHLCLAVIEGTAQGLQNWAVVHDSYGTYASDTPVLAKAIRSSFWAMYTDHDVLAEWKAAQEKRTGLNLNPIPEKGDLDINQVLDSKYFFG